MNNSMVTDTMAVVLHLEKRRLPQRVRSLFEDAEKGNRKLYIPAMVLAEIGYLSEKGRIDVSLKDVIHYSKTHPAIEVLPITAEVMIRTFEIDDIPELHDRIIAGTALRKKLMLITNDPVISRSQYVTAIW